MADPWDFEEVYAALHDFARSYPFDPEREDYLVHITTGTHVARSALPPHRVAAPAGHARADLAARRAPRPTRAPAPGAIIDLDLSRYDRLAVALRRRARERAGGLKAGIETRNAAFNALIDRIERVALASRAPILLTGPTGAGKSPARGPHLRAEEIAAPGEGRPSWRSTARRCAATARCPRSSATRRAPSPAPCRTERGGCCARPTAGVLFLDEIGELGLDEQAMLLRALEEKRFRPMGATAR
jgi:transcriptional regulatory protein RtcR